MNLGVDIGGTFTDVVAYDPGSGAVSISKVLSGGHGPRSDLLNALAVAHIDAKRIQELAHGTTLVTNLLVERTGANVGLITTRGFRDVLEIQRSYRARSLDVMYAKTPSLVPRHLRVEVGGRIDAKGKPSEAIDEVEVEQAITQLLQHGIESVAVALYNAYANPAHERQVRDVLTRVAPRLPVTLSSDIDPKIGEYERTSTAVLNAMAMPRMAGYVDDLGEAIPSSVYYMHSAAGILPAEEAKLRPLQLAFSGPAAGVLAGRAVARELNHRNVITMDMGGTSCDVSLIWQGEFRLRTEFEVEWGVPARVRSIDVHSIGAGGGSICWQDAGGALRVGPRSAGALPGPACYGRGGTEPTVTDANLALGILPPEGLLGGHLPLDHKAATSALSTLGQRFHMSAEETARGVHAIVSASMAQTIRQITVRRGLDPRDCALVAFGGAGPQHAAAVADQLGVRVIVIPAHCSVLSAAGLLAADFQITSARTLLMPLERAGGLEVEQAFRELAADAEARLGNRTEDSVIVDRFVGLHYAGQFHEIAIPYHPTVDELAARFEQEHERLYGTRLGDPIEIVDCWVRLTRPRSVPASLWQRAASETAGQHIGARHVGLFRRSVPVYNRAEIVDAVTGPCLIDEPQSVTVVPTGAIVRPRSAHLSIELAG